MKNLIATAILAAISLAPLAAGAGAPAAPADKPAATDKDKDHAKDKEQVKQHRARAKPDKTRKDKADHAASKDKSKEVTPAK